MLWLGADLGLGNVHYVDDIYSSSFFDLDYFVFDDILAEDGKEQEA
jgi:hypothetical protein